MASTIKIVERQVLAHDFHRLDKVIFDYHRRDGRWQRMDREVYDRGNAAAVLPYNPAAGTVILTRQFRLPIHGNGGHDGWLIEIPAGRLDGTSPEETVYRETEEETGYRIGPLTLAFESFMSPGSVTEKLWLYVAPYDSADRVADGGGLDEDGEDIEVLEVAFDEALAMVERGEIADAKTIIMLYYAERHGLLDRR